MRDRNGAKNEQRSRQATAGAPVTVDAAAADNVIALPEGAARPGFVMENGDNRDQVAGAVARDGWTGFETPLPEYLYGVARCMPGLVIDVGSNTGFYALLAASASSRNTVLAFEPMAEIAERARRNVVRNDLAGRIRVQQVALSDRNGLAEFYVPDDAHGLVETSASLRRDFKGEPAAIRPVASHRLDRVLLRGRWAARPISLIKIDVEGHEAAVLNGARWTIRLRRPVLFVEVLPNADLPWLNHFVRRRRYVDVKLGPGRLATPCDAVAHDPAAWNHALVPREKLARFLALRPPPDQPS